MVDYQDDESGLKQLLNGLEHIQGTFPPVYNHNGFLIGYDKVGQLKVLGSDPDRQPPRTPWLFRKLSALVQPLRSLRP